MNILIIAALFLIECLLYLSKCPGELHVLGSCIATLQQPRPAVHVHQTLVVIVVDCWTQHSQVKLLRAGVVHILQGHRAGLRKLDFSMSSWFGLHQCC